MIKHLAALIFILAASFNLAFAVTVESLGEAEIVGEDTASARMLAVSRAKWSALEQASGVKVKIDTIMVDASLADEAVKTSLAGTIKSFNVLEEGKDGNIFWVTIRADIIPDEAKKTLNAMAKNTSIAVFIRSVSIDGKISYGSSFASAIEKELIDKGFEVSGASLRSVADIALIDKALESEDYELLKELTYKTMSTAFLIGTLKAESLGNDIGYSKIDFSIVTGKFDWKLVGEKDDKKVLLTSGNVAGRGQGAVATAAENNLSMNMAKSGAIKVVSEVSQKILGENAKIIKLTMVGETNTQYFRELKDDLKNIPFVLDVKEMSLKDFAVNYPEKTYYLASFLQRNNKYRVVKMEDAEIIIERR